MRNFSVLLLALVVVVVVMITRGHVSESATVLRQDLDAAGYDWAHVEVMRGRAHLTGEVPAAGMGSEALSVARRARCRTLVRSSPCVRSVTADFGSDVPLEEAWPDLVVAIRDGVLSISGQVPDQAARNTILAAARSAARSASVDRVLDDLAVGGGVSPAGTRPLLKRFTLALSLCRSGHGTVAAGATRLTCTMEAGVQDSLRALMATPLPAGELADFELYAIPAPVVTETPQG